MLDPKQTEVFQMLSNATGATTSDPVGLVGGDYAMSIDGNLGAGSIQLQRLNRRSNAWHNYGAAVTVNDDARTPPGPVTFGAMGGAQVRVVGTGALVGVDVVIGRMA